MTFYLLRGISLGLVIPSCWAFLPLGGSTKQPQAATSDQTTAQTQTTRWPAQYLLQVSVCSSADVASNNMCRPGVT